MALPAATWASSPSATQPSQVTPDLQDLELTPRIMLISVQIAAILIAAKLMGWLCERIKVPGVIGELLAGVIIGPFLLGGVVPIPVHGQWVPLFPAPQSPDQWPLNAVIWSLAQFASVILLFVTGLHTDLKQFLRYMGPATVVATVGLLVPFALGTGVVYIPVFSEMARHDASQSVLIPALFVGAILAATSIGITARVLSDIGKLDTPEGVTIIGAAVLDDVLGIIALAIVGGIAAAGSVSVGAVSLIAFKALGFWVVLTAAVLLLSRRIERMIRRVNYTGAMVGLGLALAFLCSAAAEGFGLAFIIGAYSVGLGLSQTKMAHEMMDQLRPISDFIVPIFFAALGMLVDFHAMLSNVYVIGFGLVVTLVAITGKLFGCGGAALATGFSARGAYRIGVGMMPRGEVALIVAGIGLSRGIVQETVFGVSIMMTLLTTVLAPLLLVPAFRLGGSGRRGAPPAKPAPAPSAILPGIDITVPADLGELMLNRLLALAEAKGWETTLDDASREIYLLRSNSDAAEVRRFGEKLHVHAPEHREKDFEAMLKQVRDSVVRDTASALTKHAAEAGPR